MNCLVFLELDGDVPGDVAGLVLSAHVAAAAKGVKWGIPVKGPLYFLTTYPKLMQVDLDHKQHNYHDEDM